MIKMKTSPSPEILRRILDYNAETGVFTWLPRTADLFDNAGRPAFHKAALWNSQFAGTQALKYPATNGYLTGTIMMGMHRAHRVAWAIHYGEWPDRDIDHINGNRKDNRICNLRLVTRSENMRNARIPSHNKSGCIGVCWNKGQRSWRAVIVVNKRQIHVGSFQTKEAAISARKVAEIKYGFHVNHGRAA